MSILDLELLLDLPPKRLFLLLFLPLPLLLPDMALFLTLELLTEDVLLSVLVEKSLPLPLDGNELLLSFTVCILLLRFSLLFDKLF